MKTSISYYFKIFILALVFSLPVIFPYFKDGFFPTHDGEWAVVRLSEMYREVKDFQIPARFSAYLNLQYGYPLFNFQYPMPYYIGVVLVFLKFGFVNAIKLLFALSVILSFFSMFMLGKSVWKSSLAGIISSIFYVYVPYRIVDLYVRGSLGESLSFVLFPLILLGIKRLYSKKTILNVFIVALLYGMLITMHNIMAVLFSLIILSIAIVALVKKQIIFLTVLLLSILYSLCLSAFFWLPALFEKNLILLSKVPIANRDLYFADFSKLLIPKWGYGVPTDINGFSYQIGIPQILIFILVLILLITKKKTKDAKTAFFLIITTVVFSALMFPQTSFIWSLTPLLSEINYPWTNLAIIMLLISLLSGYLVSFGKLFIVSGFALAILAMVMIIPNAKPQTTINRGDAFYLTNQATTTSSNELMPLWVKQQPQKQPDEKIENLTGKEAIETLQVSSNKILFRTFLASERTIQVNLIYFPGWKAYVNKKEGSIEYDNPKGVIRLNLNKGENSVGLFFKETPIRLLGDLISLLSFLALPVIYLIYRYKLKTVFKL